MKLKLLSAHREPASIQKSIIKILKQKHWLTKEVNRPHLWSRVVDEFCFFERILMMIEVKLQKKKLKKIMKNFQVTAALRIVVKVSRWLSFIDKTCHDYYNFYVFFSFFWFTLTKLLIIFLYCKDFLICQLEFDWIKNL